MRLSTRTRYGMRALMDLTLHEKEQPVQLKDIAMRQNLSLPYLEHLIIPLVSAGIIKTTRGSKGGVTLAKDPAEIKLKEILEVLEGPLAPVDCLKGGSDCARSGVCATQEIWNEMKNAMESVLVSHSLKDLAERQKNQEVLKANMYYI
jgi:Rrf2 family transcriptional regulator, cysteine metabolism repressor